MLFGINTIIFLNILNSMPLWPSANFCFPRTPIPTHAKHQIQHTYLKLRIHSVYRCFQIISYDVEQRATRKGEQHEIPMSKFLCLPYSVFSDCSRDSARTRHGSQQTQQRFPETLGNVEILLSREPSRHANIYGSLELALT